MAEGTAAQGRGSRGTITFNVRGQRFEVLPELILGKPETLLAQLLCDIGTDAAEPIFVDASARRFEHILDWYRYGKMWAEEGPLLDAILHDAGYFLLPDEVVVNGRARAVVFGGSGNADIGKEIPGSYIDGVLREWPDFEALFTDMLSAIRGVIADSVAESKYEDIAYESQPARKMEMVSVDMDSLFDLDATLARRCAEQVFNLHRQRAFVHRFRRAGIRVSEPWTDVDPYTYTRRYVFDPLFEICLGEGAESPGEFTGMVSYSAKWRD